MAVLLPGFIRQVNQAVDVARVRLAHDGTHSQGREASTNAAKLLVEAKTRDDRGSTDKRTRPSLLAKSDRLAHPCEDTHVLVY